jgi:hypothetical protein
VPTDLARSPIRLAATSDEFGVYRLMHGQVKHASDADGRSQDCDLKALSLRYFRTDNDGYPERVSESKQGMPRGRILRCGTDRRNSMSVFKSKTTFRRLLSKGEDGRAYAYGGGGLGLLVVIVILVLILR